MKIIKCKTSLLVLTISLLLGMTMLLTVHTITPTAAQAQTAQIETEAGSVDPLEVIALVEEELREKGTSIHEVLLGQVWFVSSSMR